ncbi:uncharacterized protein LOC123450902 [Hordeum vulgare subsp. vulgare]|uniref:uncharacterized protein LOC123450902 n=1 Tax=Hordeum vulgare subsp. vulgare TaxID=112509 RepID=UPI001D1A4D6A|nr:uncharacterized protein LOC123450902 [Hordeum vulgare subsp. vulgare]
MSESRGSISFFGTYRPPVPMEIFSSSTDPRAYHFAADPHLTDGVGYNQNGHPVPPLALREILDYLLRNKPHLAARCGVTQADLDNGRLTGLIFVSEREDGLETLHLCLSDRATRSRQVVNLLGDIYGVDVGVRMEDTGCIAGGFTVGIGRRARYRTRTVGYSVVYVSTKDPAKKRRTPWTVVYRTNLADGSTEPLTPPGEYDLSPAVSPCGKMVAVANFKENRWNGAIENLDTCIKIMNVDAWAQGGLNRRVVIKNGGWPTWGSDNVIFFHRGLDTGPPTNKTKWAVFRFDIRREIEEQVTPTWMDAMTPAAITDTRVAVATIRVKSDLVEAGAKRPADQCRHIEIFDTATRAEPMKITHRWSPHVDHYNPFVLDEGRRVGYHRCRTVLGNNNVGEKKLDKVRSDKPEVELVRVAGVFPSITKDGKKLAFVDNQFKAVWLAVSGSTRPRNVYQPKPDPCNRSPESVFSTSWNQNDTLDTLYVCQGTEFRTDKPVRIMMIRNVSSCLCTDPVKIVLALTHNLYNCAFPSSNREGDKLVFRCSSNKVEAGQMAVKNLYIIDAMKGESGPAGAIQLTEGQCIDTHCSWSPRPDCGWIVFSSSRHMSRELDQGLDAGYFAVYLVCAKGVVKGQTRNPVMVVRSGDYMAGHVNHPVFSPDMKSIVFTADLAAVSAEPVSLPHFTHSVRPYGDIFSVELTDSCNIWNNYDIKEFHRVTHSRYEYSTPTWSRWFNIEHHNKWEMPPECRGNHFQPPCPHVGGLRRA